MRISLRILFFVLFINVSKAQSPVRISLYEGFIGENCPPSAQCEPALNLLLANNAALVIPLKWEPPIPSAPSTTWSLYQTNKAEIDWRWKYPSQGGYGYPCTSCSPTVPSINWVPQGRLDGQDLLAFGLTGVNANHIANLTAAAIASAQAQPTNFSIDLATNWSPTYTNCVVSVTVSSSSNFTSVGALMFRLCLVERVINFPVAPGTNGQMHFENEVRKSYPTVPSGTMISNMGTPLSSTWTIGQTQIFTVSCNIPSYIQDLNQAAFVGFIQDDGNKKVWQAARTNTIAVSNDGATRSFVNIPQVGCNSSITPSAIIKNKGTNAITTLTIVPYMNSLAISTVTWSGNINPGDSATINLGTANPQYGSNTYSIFLTGVNAGDYVMSNNYLKKTFFNANIYNPAPVVEGFANPQFPPAGWGTANNTSSNYPWQRATGAGAGGFGTSNEASRIYINLTPIGQTQEMYLPGTSLTNTLFPLIKFDLSYIQVAATDTDKLAVQISTNCGGSWNTVWSNQGAAMATAPINSISLAVPMSTQWVAVNVPIYSYSNTPGILARFQATGGGGNTIWVDNVNLIEDPSAGYSPINAHNTTLEIFPNPAKEYFTIKISSPESFAGEISILDIMGKQLYLRKIDRSEGTEGLRINTTDLPSGSYTVLFKTRNGSVKEKLIIVK